jgi:hypothetical protein
MSFKRRAFVARKKKALLSAWYYLLFSAAATEQADLFLLPWHFGILDEILLYTVIGTYHFVISSIRWSLQTVAIVGGMRMLIP